MRRLFFVRPPPPAAYNASMAWEDSETESSRADRAVDELYAAMRARYGPCDPRANGYRLVRWFLREQELVFDALAPEPGLVLDIACGSALMLKPFANVVHPVVGVEFNAIACEQARANGMRVVRGDAFSLPFAEASVRQAIACQFLNQQAPANARRFVLEAGRVLEPGGRLIILWRNHRAVVHRLGHALLGGLDRLRGRAGFPMVDNTLAAVTGYAREAALEVLERAAVLPLAGRRYDPDRDWRARWLGASLLLVLRKQAGEGP